MDIVNNETIRRLTYKYDSKMQKDIHMEQMIKDGWHIARNPYAFFDTENPLRVTYEQTANNLYSVARL